jgi:hypothetical protein
MKMKTNQSTFVFLAAAILAGACAKKTPPPADASDQSPPEPSAAADSRQSYVEGIAGGVMSSSMTIDATIVSVDLENHAVVLEGPEGNQLTVFVGKDAVGIYEVEPGDQVEINVFRELLVYVDGAANSETDGTSVSTESNDTGGSVIETSKVTTTIVSMDQAARTATLSLPDGSQATFEVRPDVDMTQYSVGEQVVFLLTDMLAVGVKML